MLLTRLLGEALWELSLIMPVNTPGCMLQNRAYATDRTFSILEEHIVLSHIKKPIISEAREASLPYQLAEARGYVHFKSPQ